MAPAHGVTGSGALVHLVRRSISERQLAVAGMLLEEGLDETNTLIEVRLGLQEATGLPVSVKVLVA